MHADVFRPRGVASREPETASSRRRAYFFVDVGGGDRASRRGDPRRFARRRVEIERRDRIVFVRVEHQIHPRHRVDIVLLSARRRRGRPRGARAAPPAVRGTPANAVSARAPRARRAPSIARARARRRRTIPPRAAARRLGADRPRARRRRRRGLPPRPRDARRAPRTEACPSTGIRRARARSTSAGPGPLRTRVAARATRRAPNHHQVASRRRPKKRRFRRRAR